MTRIQHVLNWRRFMVTAAIITVAAGLPLKSGGAALSLQSITVAMDWTANTNHIGFYVAREKGFYREAGLDVNILPYSDTSAELLVANKIADFGVMGPVGLFIQRSAGAQLVAVYAIVQHETGRLVFNDERQDIQTPKDLDGKTYAGFGSDWEQVLIKTLIQNDGGKGEFNTVTLGTSAYQALANGTVDFTLEISTWEGVKAKLDGVKQRGFRYSDYGLPDQYTTLIGSNETFLNNNPETAKAFITATQRGYEFAVDHPEEAVEILVTTNPDVLTDAELTRASLRALIEGHFFRDKNGVIGLFSPQRMEAIGQLLYNKQILRDANGDLLKQKPDFSDYFSNAYQPE